MNEDQEMPPVRLAPPHIADVLVRRGVRVLRMVHELHRLGYGHLRIQVRRSARGDWSCAVGAIDEIGAMAPSALYDSADPDGYFGWGDAGADNAKELAARFVDRFPEIVAAAVGRDFEYAGWFTELLGEAEQGRLPDPIEPVKPPGYLNGGVTVTPISTPAEQERRLEVLNEARWIALVGIADAVRSVPRGISEWHETALGELYRLIVSHGWARAVDPTDPVINRMGEDPGAIATAPAAEIEQLMYFMWRSDHMTDGWATFHRSGAFDALLNRVRLLGPGAGWVYHPEHAYRVGG